MAEGGQAPCHPSRFPSAAKGRVTLKTPASNAAALYQEPAPCPVSSARTPTPNVFIYIELWVLDRSKTCSITQTASGICNNMSRETKPCKQQELHAIQDCSRARQAGRISKRTLSPALFIMLSEVKMQIQCSAQSSSRLVQEQAIIVSSWWW